MVLDVLHAEHAGGGPGFVLVRIHGRARADAACRLVPPALLVADGADLVRLPPLADTPALVAGPDAPPFTLDVPVPLHLAWGAGGWWLEPPIASPSRPGADREAAIADLRTRLATLGDEVAALRARVDAEAAASPAAGAAAVPRPRFSRISAAMPAVLVAVGALAVGDAAATYFWQEPISAFYAARQQSALRGDLHALDNQLAREPLQLPARPEQRMRALARTLERKVPSGRPLGKLTIPSIDASYVVVQGTGSGSLRRGPGHYASTALPGEPGTVGIAGHRTTFGAPFRHLDDLRRGDPIDMKMPYGRFRYRVEATRIVRPQDVSVLAGAGHDRLTLTACHPLYSAAKRIVVMARLERATPAGPALRRPSLPPAGGDGAAPTPRA